MGGVKLWEVPDKREELNNGEVPALSEKNARCEHTREKKKRAANLRRTMLAREI